MKKKVIIIVSVLALIAVSGMLFLYINHQNGHKRVKAQDGKFLFDTYVSVTTNTEAKHSRAIQARIFELLSSSDSAYEQAFGVKARDLAGNDTIKNCLVKTAKLNKEYGDRINLTCGEVTSLWGISTNNPRVPTADEITNALKSIEGTDYHGGDFLAFGENTMLDLGAVAKGMALDNAMVTMEFEFHNTYGAHDDNDYFIISLGSSSVFYGSKPDGTKFRTAIRNPYGESEYLGFIDTDEAYISTSGGYERYFEADGTTYEHILDIDTGYPVETDLASVTVIIPITSYDVLYNGGLKSDFLSTLIYIDGTKGIEKYLHADDFYVVAADNDRNIYLSENMPEGMFISPMVNSDAE